jgi:hypothetical protein
MSIKPQVLDLIRLVEDGRMLDAITKYYAQNVAMQENVFPPVVGLAANYEREAAFYGSLLAGSALRGCKVLIIAPSLASAPSSAPPTMARAHGLLSALLSFQNGLKEELSHAGGVLRGGL